MLFIILLHASFEERGNTSRTGTYLPSLQKVIESASRKKSAGGFSFEQVELLAVSGQESVVLAAEVEKLGNCSHRGVNCSELSCLSCARQVVRVVHFCTVITRRCIEPLEKLVDSSDQCTTPTTTCSFKRPTAARSLTGEPIQRNAIELETRLNVVSPFSSPKPMANTIRPRRVKSSTWSFIIETKGVTTKTQACSSFHKSFSRRGSNI